ncbi:aconitate hydratase, putative [Syntrophotalea carbinolica DSM 2380]|uniref:Aconitate hydratase, putative n=1 Tax=Syntrophotalea carbinolica (strain DSM 2380 / NBRC 103641 / GraBd1) TaxID=338963 RepID=Q3A1R8_SYNC1|nr:aconitate hydratase [Syntrophotalea carbinolica]ABA89689.1 aconitate hydratase, putative [Syntrophotalea carbinolica DSM 2380]
MPSNVTRKVLENHLVEGRLLPGEEIAVRIDHTLLQDATGTMAMLEFEALGLEKVRTQLAAQYVDHNLLQTDFKNADDHRYLQTACARYGIHFSRPGNGISHQVHLENFGRPGLTMLGADSHTPAAAGLSMLAMGAGGLDVALAMAGRAYYLPCPEVLGVKLVGKLPDWVSAKDIILEMLRRYDVKGCLGKVVEYYGPGVATLSVEDRAVIGNMGTELGATSSIFPSDDQTRAYLQSQARGDVWVELQADPGSTYDAYDEIDLSTLEPLIACPSSPGKVVTVREVAGIPVDQVIVGSSANSGLKDLLRVVRIVDGRHSAAHTDFHINPGSRQVLENVAEADGILPLMLAGAKIHQSGCLGCIGMGQAPGTGQVSLRTFPRNFPGRSGTRDDQVYLCSPETAAAAALHGRITDPRDLGLDMPYPRIEEPKQRVVDRSSIVYPNAEDTAAEVLRGPNIKPFPQLDALPENLRVTVAIKVGDNISTDGIMPAGNQVLPLRSNIEAISAYVFYQLDPDFPARCRELGAAAVVAGDNYGQGSSREHAALAPRYLGVRLKLAKSFARIHKANLCNFGILPLTFKNPADYDRLTEGAVLEIDGVRQRIERGDTEIPVRVNGTELLAVLSVSERQRACLLAGGTLNLVRKELG